MKARRSDKQRSAAFEKFNKKSPRSTLFCLKPIIATGVKHEISEKKHQAMLDKAKGKKSIFQKIADKFKRTTNK